MAASSPTGASAASTAYTHITSAICSRSGAPPIISSRACDAAKSVANWAASATSSRAAVASRGWLTPARPRTRTGPTLNHELAKAKSSRDGGRRRRSTSGVAARASASAVSIGTAGSGTANSIGTKARTRGTVKPPITGKRTRDATAITSTSTIVGPAENAVHGSARASAAHASRKPPPTTVSARRSPGVRGTSGMSAFAGPRAARRRRSRVVTPVHRAPAAPP